MNNLRDQLEQELLNQFDLEFKKYLDTNEAMLEKQEKTNPGSYQNIKNLMTPVIYFKCLDDIIKQLNSLLALGESTLFSKLIPIDLNEVKESLAYFTTFTQEYKDQQDEEENYFWDDEGKGMLVKKPRIILTLREQREKQPCQCTLCKERGLVD